MNQQQLWVTRVSSMYCSSLAYAKASRFSYLHFIRIVGLSLVFSFSAFISQASAADGLPLTIQTTVSNFVGSKEKTQSGVAPGLSGDTQICELVEWVSTCHSNSDGPYSRTALCCTFTHPDGTITITCDDDGLGGIQIEHPETCEMVDLDDLCHEYLNERPFDDYMDLPAWIRNYCETNGGGF